jgi:hypothetical protein
MQTFTRAVEQQLQTRRVPFALAELIEFLEDSWRHVQDDPDPSLWADAFVRGERVEVAFPAFGRGD